MSEDETTADDIPTVTRFPLSVETFEEDALGLEPFCRSLENYLMVDHDFVEGSLVVSLNAEFGFGKSTFLKMWENDLNARREKEATTQLAINLNAWESDYCDEPLLPIISALIEAIEATVEKPDIDPTINKLKEAAKDVAWFTLGVANSVVKEGLKIDALAAGKLAKEKKNEREAAEAARPDLLDEYQKRRYALNSLKKLLKEYLAGDTPKAFIFIDELDRCRPDYAVSYLETIKHVFDIHGLVFVLAVDYAHLENSAKSLYGPNLKFREYFRKFVQRSFELPEPTDAARHEFARRLTGFYLHNKKTRFSRLDLNKQWAWLPDLIAGLKMTPRQAMEFFRILGHLTCSKKEEPGRLYVGYAVGMILMSAFKVTHPRIYKQLGTAEMPHAEIAMIFNNGIEHFRARWLFLVYITGTLETKKTYEYLKTAKLLSHDDTEETVSKALGQISMQTWDMISQNIYPQFYAQIESKQLR